MWLWAGPEEHRGNKGDTFLFFRVLRNTRYIVIFQLYLSAWSCMFKSFHHLIYIFFKCIKFSNTKVNVSPQNCLFYHLMWSPHFCFISQSGTLLDPHQSLSPAQKDIQRQNTLQLLHQSLQIPESETELQETLTLIQELNSLQIVLVQSDEGTVETETVVESGWPRFYESTATNCGLCNYPLFKGGQRWEHESLDYKGEGAMA